MRISMTMRIFTKINKKTKNKPSGSGISTAKEIIMKNKNMAMEEAIATGNHEAFEEAINAEIEELYEFFGDELEETFNQFLDESEIKLVISDECNNEKFYATYSENEEIEVDCEQHNLISDAIMGIPENTTDKLLEDIQHLGFEYCVEEITNNSTFDDITDLLRDKKFIGKNLEFVSKNKEELKQAISIASFYNFDGNKLKVEDMRNLDLNNMNRFKWRILFQKFLYRGLEGYRISSYSENFDNYYSKWKQFYITIEYNGCFFYMQEEEFSDKFEVTPYIKINPFEKQQCGYAQVVNNFNELIEYTWAISNSKNIPLKDTYKQKLYLTSGLYTIYDKNSNETGLQRMKNKLNPKQLEIYNNLKHVSMEINDGENLVLQFEDENGKAFVYNTKSEK